MMRYTVAFLLMLPFFVLAQPKQITLEDIYKKGTFRTDFVPGFNSLNNGDYYVETINGNIVRKAFKTGNTVDTLVKSLDVKDADGNKIPIADYVFSSNENKLLISIERESIYRRSYKAKVYVYDIVTKKTVLIDTAKILHASFSPDASKVAYVKKNNLYVKNLATNTTTQITTDGKWNHIINGNADWVYEEEFSLSKAFQWSANGNFIAYYKFNESQVKEYTMAYFEDLYPRQYTYKYPKAGEANSTIGIYVYNMATKKNVQINIGAEKDIYIPRIKFTQNNEQLSITWMNRHQNHMRLLLANVYTGNTTVYHEEKNKYYIEMESGNITFLKDGKHFIYTSEKSGYKHIYMKALNGSTDTQLTQGNFDCDGFVEIDETNSKIYYGAAYPTPMNRTIFSIDFAGNNKKVVQGNNGITSVRFNKNFTYYVSTFSSITTPPIIQIFETATNKLVRTLKNNADLATLTKNYNFATPNFIQVPNGKGDSLHGWMLKPTNFDATKKYPLLFCNYGGPGSQQVANRWGAVSAWHQYFAQQGIIVVCIDNTGTGFRGEEFKKKTYLQLGKLEIEDQIAAAKYLAHEPFVDSKNIGHYGWSFGGFMSSLAITKGADIFTMAVAGAPVTSWRFYDNIYTERYMRTPQENKQGYDDNAPMNFVKNIKGKFLIVHGTADDNVHFQNSVMMVNEMIKHNIHFESSYYPNKAHGFRGDNSEMHNGTVITNFIVKNLGQQ